VIRTTAEHPFWVYNRGWQTAGELRPGDALLGHDGGRTAVEEVLDTGESETVYNLRVADYHTYFVGRRAWGFSAWAHNAEYPGSEEDPADLVSNRQLKQMEDEEGGSGFEELADAGDQMDRDKKAEAWQRAQARHDARVEEVFPDGEEGQILDGGARRYDRRVMRDGEEWDVELKSNRSWERDPGNIDHIESEAAKDIRYQANGKANPWWHFDVDPTQAQGPRMRSVLENLLRNDIRVTWGGDFTPVKLDNLGWLP